jgi:hypothetical protein
VLLIGATADVLLHRLHHPPVHGWGGRHRFVSSKLAQRGGGDARRRRRRRPALPFLDRVVRRPFDQACAAQIE